MASSSDGGRRMKPNFSSMKQPPLIKQLKGILSEYPDGGQIIKELVQNAEDAGASEIDIIYDRRCINEDVDPSVTYSKFFKGPALCVYNDALFTESDWEGIKMIYSSVKEEDRLKVGRFGLGFKSVFHMTDYPCVLSGSRLLLINPQETAMEVNAEFELQHLHNYEGMDVDHFLAALGGIHGLNKHTLEGGEFNGTIFWFPLRQQESKLSETIYHEEKVMNLFKAFQKETASILLFLKCLKNITLNIKNQDSTFEDFASVELVGEINDVDKKRQLFKADICALDQGAHGDPVSSFVCMDIKTVTHNDGERNETVQKWIVINYFMGNNASNRFKKLITDKSLSYSPCVGIAAPFENKADAFEGHVFCFLPLPNEGSKQTGLPFHVNGFFALSQNRHHLKWETDEQRGQTITDKSILWNQTLIEEALPCAFRALLEGAIEIAKENGCIKEAVENIYRLIPNKNNVLEKWGRFLKPMFEKLSSLPFLNVKGTQDWVTIDRAFYATFKGAASVSESCRESVVTTLCHLNQNYVDIPTDVFKIIQIFCLNISDLTTNRLFSLLHKDNRYRILSKDVKFGLLNYLLHENNYDRVKSLELIPLMSGKWSSFQPSKKAEKILVCTDEEIELIPGYEDEVLQLSALPAYLQNHFKDMTQKGIFNLRWFSDQNPGTLIKNVLVRTLGTKQHLHLNKHSKLTHVWLRNVWKYFLKHSSVAEIENIPLVPILHAGTWNNPSDIELCKLKELILVKATNEDCIPENICQCLLKLSVTILPSLPDWIPLTDINEYVFLPTKSSMMNLLARISSLNSIEKVIENFNRNCDTNARKGFVDYLLNFETFDRKAIFLIRKLAVFIAKTSLNSAEVFVSLEKNNKFTQCTDFPVRFTDQILIVNTNNCSLLSKLDAKEIKEGQLILMTLHAINKSVYNQSEIIDFMKYFIRKLDEYAFNSEVISEAKTIHFLNVDSIYRKPSDLLNPFDQILQNLFQGENLFPDKHMVTDEISLRSLLKLGLRERKDVTAEEVLKVARDIDKVNIENFSEATNKKADALLTFLTQFPHVLETFCDRNKTLKQYLTNLRWVRINEKRPSVYPCCLSFVSESVKLCKPEELIGHQWCSIIGSVMPVIKTSDKTISNKFNWLKNPSVVKVLEHLNNINNAFEVRYKPELLMLVKAVYNFLNSTRPSKNTIMEKEIIWNGKGFSVPSKMIIRSTEFKISMNPYFYTVPVEFVDEFGEMFIKFGGFKCDNTDVLLTCLSRIQESYNGQNKAESEVQRDLSIVENILNSLVNKNIILSHQEKERILVPVRSENQGHLEFRHVTDCTYTESPDDIYEEEQEQEHFVHSRIGIHVVKYLGIKSLDLKTLSETEGLEADEWGQSESLTARINSLLREGYKDGLSVPKELLQNADDAGAKTVKFLYDERQNENMRSKLLSRGMKECQGPALWVYNDAYFTEEDFTNLIKLNGATKQGKSNKIGKFGLGFCSVYNLTDVPSILSGNTLVILDPHKSYMEDSLPGNSPGIRIDFNKTRNKTVLKKYIDQFQPYEGVFGCSLSPRNIDVKGTLFRFPLRTKDQSHRSEISKIHYSEEEVIKLLEMFMRSAGDNMLFTQNIQEVEMYYLKENDASEMKQFFSMLKYSRLTNQMQFQKELTNNVLTRASQVCFSSTFNETQFLKIDIKSVEECKKSTLENPCLKESSAEWIVSWSSGTDRAKTLALNLIKKGALPLAAIALPCLNDNLIEPMILSNLGKGFQNEGHLFCFLPLPLKNGLKIHFNACFDVTSDRRQLIMDSEDDKESQSNRWNNVIMEDAGVNAFFELLIFLTKSQLTGQYRYYSLWPLRENSTIVPFVKGFYHHIIDNDAKLFEIDGKWLSFSEITFIDPQLRQTPFVGEAVFWALQKFPPRKGKYIIEMPFDVLNMLQNCNKKRQVVNEKISQAIIHEEEAIVHYLSTLSKESWEDHKDIRDHLIIFALKSKNQRVRDTLKDSECVPSEPHDKLRRPCELVHPQCPLAILFRNDDGYFPSEKKEFREKVILDSLSNLGMILNSLPNSLLIDRCKSVSLLGKSCCQCSLDRSTEILNYLSRGDVSHDVKKDEVTLNTIKNVAFLPVLPRPENWCFTWAADSNTSLECHSSSDGCNFHPDATAKSLHFARPCELHRRSTQNCVGTSKMIVDESKYSIPGWFSGRKDALNILNVKEKNNLGLAPVLQQLRTVSKEYNNPDIQFELLKKITEDVFNWLVEKQIDIKDEEVESFKEQIRKLSTTEVILTGKQLVTPLSVAFSVTEECPPYIYRLPVIGKKKKKLYEMLGVRETFSVDDILQVMNKNIAPYVNTIWLEISCIHKLLSNLVHSMEIEGKSFEDIKDHQNVILAPDEEQTLRLTCDLAIQNTDFKTQQNLHILHGSIPKNLALSVGVKSKERKCFQNLAKAIPFGQKEELVTRLNGLLHAYPCDSSIMKELLQNADDAAASEIHFIKDFRKHRYSSEFGCSNLNEPSICVFNNSSFTEEDLRGIRNLGLGSKRKDATKTGQYGVGFNAVYHITDTPSFLSFGPELENGGTLCIFDPLCSHIEGVEKDQPGVRFEVNSLREDFPDVLSGFLENEIMTGRKGTLFRFPLRKTPSDITKTVLTQEEINKLFDTLKNDMLDALLFVKNVNCIKISDISSGQLKEEYIVRTSLSNQDEQNRTRFYGYVKEVANQNQDDKVKNLAAIPMTVNYKMKVEDNCGFKKKWLIVQKFGFGEKDKDECSEQIIMSFKDENLGFLPLGGIALSLDIFRNNDNRTDKMLPLITKGSKAFCFLPLPIKTGLPLHVNGHFALDHEARRDLWEGGYREDWNTHILKHIIIPSWVLALKYLQKKEIESITWPTFKVLREALFCYHELFPKEAAKTDFWKKCVKLFYEHVLRNEVNLFAVVKWETIKRSAELKNPVDISSCLTWTALRSHSCNWNGIFNTIHTFRTNSGYAIFDKDQIRQIETLLKQVGMKLIETPLVIQRTIEKHEFETNSSSPSFVIEFLKSFNSNEVGCCEIGNIGTHVEKTNLENVRNVQLLTRYLQLEREFISKANGLPILLNGKSTVNVCSEQEKLFLTEYSDLLPASLHLFVHKEVIPLFKGYEKEETSFLKPFNMTDFAELLPYSCPQSHFAIGKTIKWGEMMDSIVTKEWIYRLFLFMCGDNEKDFLQNTKCLEDWSFLPYYSKMRDRSETGLLPIKCAYTIHKTAYGNHDVEEALKKLKLPAVDKSVLDPSRNQGHSLIEHSVFNRAKSLVSPVKKLVASTEKPYDLLLCLVHHRSSHKLMTISVEMAFTLLSYFNQNLETLKEMGNGTLAETFRRLPLFVTQQNSVISLENSSDVTVLPRGMPHDGIQKWAKTMNVVLLQDSERVAGIYTYLDLSISDLSTAYLQRILPNIDKLPKEHWLPHIKFIKDSLIGTYEKNDALLEMLKSIPFIEVGGHMKRPMDLFCPDNQVFKIMLPEDVFLPKEFNNLNWIGFLKDLGLIANVNDSLLIRFAREIELDGRNSVNELTLKKSECLVSCILTMETDWKQQTLHQIRGIKFVKPHIISDILTQFCPQFHNASELICFEGSVSEENEKICWTSANLISSSFTTRMSKKTRSTLGILECPQDSDFLRHCQQVCVSFSKYLNSNNSSNENSGSIKNLMEIFYQHINKKKIIDAGRHLKYTPFVYLPDIEKIVLMHSVVVGLDDELILNNYLYKAPVFFGQYHDLFVKLGCHEKVTCSLLINILEKIHAEFGDTYLSLREFCIISKLLKHIFLLLEKDDRSIKDTQTLYLPTNRKKMKTSTDIVVCNNSYFRKRLENNIDIDFFVGFREIEIERPDQRRTFRLLPQRLQPKLLSEVVSEQTVSDRMTIVENSSTGQMLETFIHSPELLEGIIRLIKHFGDKFVTDEVITDVKTGLENVRCVQVKGLQTILLYEGRAINGSQSDKSCFMKRSLDEAIIEFYFQMDREDKIDIASLVHEDDALISLIKISTRRLVPREANDCLAHILNYVRQRHKIREILDRKHIDAYDLPQKHKKMLFPEPGTYVEADMLDFLERSIKPFFQHEFDYVAYQLDDGDNTSNDETFIYVRIINLADQSDQDVLSLRYKIFLGGSVGSFLVVPIYRLYRFLPTDLNSVEDTNENWPQTESEFKEACMKVRAHLLKSWELSEVEREIVIERLLVKWCTGKDLGNDYARRIFNYIHDVILSLERSEIVSDNISKETGLYMPDTSHSAFRNLYKKSSNRGRKCADAYTNSYKDYRRTGSSGRYRRQGSTISKVTDTGEAKRWLRQAKNDLRCAMISCDSLADVPGFNSVCHLSYQACEKAMKAVWYATDANNEQRNGSDLVKLSDGLASPFRDQARLLQMYVFDQNRMTCPRAEHRPQIPSDLYERQDAEYAIDRAKIVLQLAEEAIY